MSADDAEAMPTPASIAAYVKKNTTQAKMGPMASMHGPMESVREDEYKGHHVVIRTTYQIEVDGRPVSGHIDLSNEGQIAYHGLPNMSFDSAVDLVEKLIDQFPDDFIPGAPMPHSGMGGMAGMGGMEGMGGMAKVLSAAAKRKSPAVKSKAKSAVKSKKKASPVRKAK